MKTIHWAGDWLVDEYLYGRLDGARFVPERRVVQPGGALCASSFASHLARKLDLEVQALYSAPEYLRLTRYIQDDRTLLEAHNCDWDSSVIEPSLDPKRFYAEHAQPRSLWLFSKKPADALLLSFYNKGMASWFEIDSPKHSQQYRLAVLDCRKRELAPETINARTKIWHATGQEYSEDYAGHFTYVINTNGGQDIKVMSGKQVISTLEVQNIEGKSTLGAGDAFSAALCAFLVSGTEGAIRDDQVIRASALAAQYVQERIRASEGLTISP